MKTQLSDCPSESGLVAFLSDEVDPADEAAIARHLESCDACRTRVEEHLDWGDLEPLRERACRESTLTFKITPEDTVLNQKLCDLKRKASSSDSSVSTTPDQNDDDPDGDDLDFPDRIDKYEIGATIGRGGMGTVYLGFDPDLGRECAVKLLTPSRLDDEQAIGRAKREMKAIGKLNHVNVVSVLNAGELEDSRPWIAMEYLRGTDLETLVRSEGKLHPSRAVEMIIAAARGLQHAHKKQLVHRDVKPSNLFLTDEGTIKVLDFGLAHLAHEDLQAGSNLTKTGYIMGTVDFMSPEQASDIRNADHRSDIYSLGCTFAWLVSGKRVFKGDTITQILFAHREQPVPTLSEFRSGLPGELNDVFRRMLAKNPDERFQSMEDLIEALTPWTAESAFPGLAAPSTVGEPEELESLAATRLLDSDETKHPPRGRTVLGGLAGGVILLAAIIILVKSGDKWLKIEAENANLTASKERPEVPDGTVVLDTSPPAGATGISEKKTAPVLPAAEDAAGIIETRPELSGALASEAQISAAAFVPGEHRLLVAVAGTVETWDISELASAKRIARVMVSEKPVKALRLLPDGSGFAAGSEDSTIRVFRDDSSKPETVLTSGKKAGIHSMIIAPDGKSLIAGYWADFTLKQGFLHVWNLAPRSKSAPIIADEKVVVCMQLSPDGEEFAYGGLSDHISIRSVEPLGDVRTLHHGTDIRSICFSPNGQHLACVGTDKTLRVWDLQAADKQTPPHTISVGVETSTCRYTTDGRFILVGGTNELVVVDAVSHTIIRRVVAEGRVETLELSPDGELVAAAMGLLSGRGNGRVTFWIVADLTDGSRL